MSIEGKKELGLFVCLYIEEESLNCTHVYRKVREDTMIFITAILRVLCFERKAIIITFDFTFLDFKEIDFLVPCTNCIYMFYVLKSVALFTYQMQCLIFLYTVCQFWY